MKIFLNGGTVESKAIGELEYHLARLLRLGTSLMISVNGFAFPFSMLPRSFLSVFTSLPFRFLKTNGLSFWKTASLSLPSTSMVPFQSILESDMTLKVFPGNPRHDDWCIWPWYITPSLLSLVAVQGHWSGTASRFVEHCCRVDEFWCLLPPPALQTPPSLVPNRVVFGPLTSKK